MAWHAVRVGMNTPQRASVLAIRLVDFKPHIDSCVRRLTGHYPALLVIAIDAEPTRLEHLRVLFMVKPWQIMFGESVTWEISDAKSFFLI